MTEQPSYDVVIVGAGVAGSMIAKQLGLAGKQVLVLESGAPNPPNINEFLQRFYTAAAKVPESPYSPNIVNPPGTLTLTDPSTLNAPRPTVLSLGINGWQDPSQSYLSQQGPLPFASTYERVGGGTARHWLGTSLRFLPNDFQTQTTYHQMVDWPITYSELSPWYGKAEHEIGVSADTSDQSYLGLSFPDGYNYPMPKIPASMVDGALSEYIGGLSFEGHPLTVSSTPAGRNSRPYQSRRVCAGNTNCIPICPIQAKYDPSVTLNDALQTGNVTVWYQTVASAVQLDPLTGRVSGISYVQYQDAGGPATGTGIVKARVFVLAAHAIETPKLLLMSNKQLAAGVANRSDQVGRNLMDHPLYLVWGLMPRPVYPYRGPLSTSGIETLRDGSFRSQRAAFRIEIGNEGWNFPVGDPYTTTIDMINGTNVSGLNAAGQSLFGQALVQQLNNVFTRQFRMAFLVEQTPDSTNTVRPSATQRDHLNLPRPEIHYNLSEYTRKGFVAARQVADQIFGHLAQFGGKQFTTTVCAKQNPSTFEQDDQVFNYFGAGHVVGTYRMGSSASNSVVDKFQRSWDHPNLFLVGSGVFPTITTANPTLTISALALWAADTIKQDLSA
jgi:choline dehydrogenase-like flavoprotein